MPSSIELTGQIADAYEHLYDLVYLRSHPLTAFLVPDTSLSRRERAWRLHHILLDIINELIPGPQAPPFSHEWRRHRLVVLRYLEGLDPQTVADQLAISRRHFYREQKTVIKAIADILADRYGEDGAAAQHTAAPPSEQASPNRRELLRLEAAHAAQASRLTQLQDELPGVISLLQEPLRLKDLNLEWSIQEPLPDISLDRNLLRQVLLGITGYLIQRAEQATIHVTAQPQTASVKIAFRVEPPTAIHATPDEMVTGDLSALKELTALAHIPIHQVYQNDAVTGFEAELPTVSRHTILVVDDNEDVLELFQRYINTQQFRAVTAKTAEEALGKARQLQPFAITLDLMMPHQDGWDLLQILLNQPETRHIPILVCSVLKQKELALALGAAGFLEKPITEQELLEALMNLKV